MSHLFATLPHPRKQGRPGNRAPSGSKAGVASKESGMSKRVRKIEPGIWKMDDGHYQVDYYDPYGKRRYKHVDRLHDARNFKAKMREDSRRGDYIDPKRSRQRFGEFSAKWLETKVDKKPKTYASYESPLRIHVLPYFEKMPLGSIQREDIQAWIAKMRTEQRSSSTIRKAYQVLAAVLTEAELSKRIPRTPAYRIEIPSSKKGVQRFLTPRQINQLADAIHPRYRVLVLMGAYIGLRWGECAGLKVQDLDLRHGLAVVHRTLSEVSGKTPRGSDQGKARGYPAAGVPLRRARKSHRPLRRRRRLRLHVTEGWAPQTQRLQAVLQARPRQRRT
jgi:integrase